MNNKEALSGVTDAEVEAAVRLWFSDVPGNRPGPLGSMRIALEAFAASRALPGPDAFAALGKPMLDALPAIPEGDVQLRACDQGTGREYFIKKGPRSDMQAEADKMNAKGRDYFVTPPIATTQSGVKE